MQIVLDTNVIISGLLNPIGKPGQIVQLVSSGIIKICYDARIIAEYYSVLVREKFGFDRSDVNSFITQVKSEGILVFPQPLEIKIIDQDDLKFIEVALAGKVKYLVTGNLKHYPKERIKKLEIITPSDLLRKL